LKRRSLEIMAQEFNPAIFQAALLEVAEATKVATAAVQATQSAQQSSNPQVLQLLPLEALQDHHRDQQTGLSL
jgi:hypothetical protein